MIKRVEYVNNNTSAKFIIEINGEEYGFSVSKEALQEIIDNLIPEIDPVCLPCNPTSWKPVKFDRTL